MSKPHANPRTQELVTLVLRLRAKNASEREVELAAMSTYPGDSPTNRSMRSRLKRLFVAPDAAFERAIRAYERGKHMHEIIDEVPTVTSRGAPLGNTNSVGKRRKPFLPRLNALWRVASEADKQAFMREHGLTKKA